MRRDLIIDGMVFAGVTLEGDDATTNIISMHRSLSRNDINCILVDGLIISMYNFIDGGRIAAETSLPVIAITFEHSKGLAASIRHHFASGWQSKMDQYERLGKREQITLQTGKNLFIRYWGMGQKGAITVLNSFTLQGSVPEPIRVAKLAARSCSCLML